MTGPTVTEPGVYWDLDEAVYHRDIVEGGSLSVSSAKDLLPPSCPALFRWKQDHRETTDTMDFGTAVHTLTFGTGREIVVVDAKSWQGKEAQQAKAEARMVGNVALLTKEHEQAKAMAAAVHADPYAAPYLAGDGDTELSIFWRDEPTGVMRRGRIDYFRRGPGRPIIVDLKTAPSADPDKFASRTVPDYSYDMSGAGYREGVQALGLADDPAVIFLVVSKTEPHLVSVCELDSASLATGARRQRRAVDIYAQCAATDEWRGYPPTLVSVPAWRHYQTEELSE